MFSLISRIIAAILVTSGLASAAYYSIDSDDAIKLSASTLAYDMMLYYKGNLSGQVPGILPGPPPAGDYYWWEAGAMWGTLIDYWHLTGDSTYNDVVTQAMLFQVGPNDDYQPHNVTASLGNDDQGFWGMSAMLAAENKFPDPPSDQPQWLALAQAVFNTQADPSRHDNTCNGGLRWQIPPINSGYDYKNSIANGVFFNLGARLARYTGNTTYADWAVKTWDWVTGVGFIDANYDIYDGAHIATNCTDINRAQFSYNAAVYLLGAAYMYNYTNGSALWQQRTQSLLNTTLRVFFPENIAYEVACEKGKSCSTDMLSYKGYLHRWMATMTKVAPFTHDIVIGVLKTSATAAINQCTGGENQRTCGFQWSSGVFDGSVGVGQTMNVLAAVSSLLIDSSAAPVSNSTGGTSVGNYSAGTVPDNFFGTETSPTAGAKVSASILTLIVLICGILMFTWMSLDP